MQWFVSSSWFSITPLHNRWPLLRFTSCGMLCVIYNHFPLPQGFSWPTVNLPWLLHGKSLKITSTLLSFQLASNFMAHIMQKLSWKMLIPDDMKKHYNGTAKHFLLVPFISKKYTHIIMKNWFWKKLFKYFIFHSLYVINN